MTETIKEQIYKISYDNEMDMTDVTAVFELSIKLGFRELSNYLFEQTGSYIRFVLTGEET